MIYSSSPIIMSKNGITIDKYHLEILIKSKFLMEELLGAKLDPVSIEFGCVDITYNIIFIEKRKTRLSPEEIEFAEKSILDSPFFRDLIQNENLRSIKIN